MNEEDASVELPSDALYSVEHYTDSINHIFGVKVTRLENGQVM